VPALGLGTAPLGGWPAAVPAEQARSTVDRVWQQGIRYFDTAPLYGHGNCFLLAGRYTLLEQDAVDELMPRMIDKGMSIVAGGVYNSGLLIDPADGATYNYFPAPDDVLARARAIRGVCTARGVPMRAAALQFPLGHPAVATVVVGARTPSEVDDTLEMAAIDIPDDLWTDLKERGLMRAGGQFRDLGRPLSPGR
jgi:aryl-alcohol dehydrogenase-like predicted oxidoreductase